MAPKLIDSGISIRHAKTWQNPEAIREILQNYLDVRREFEVDGSITWDEEQGIATVQDFGPGLELRHFAFGETDKQSSSIGQFGEGLKSAMLHLVRENRKVRIYSKQYIIEPTIQTSSVFGIETMHYLLSEEQDPTRHQPGTKITVECTAEELEQAEQYFMEFVERDANFTWLEEDKISLPGGKLYVKGSYIQDINSEFSYHFGEEMAPYLNRDRNFMDKQQIQDRIERYLERTESDRVIQWLMEMFVDDKNVFETTLYVTIPSHRLDVWQKIWETKVAPTISSRPILISSGNVDMDATAQYNGYHILHLSRKAEYCLSNILQNVLEQMQKEKIKQQHIVRQKNLNQEEYRNLSLAKKLIRKHYANCGIVVIYDGLITEAGRSCDGQYLRYKDVIKLNRNILMDFDRTLHTLLHETVHKVSGEGDLTERFEQALLQVAVEMMKKKVTEKGNVRK